MTVHKLYIRLRAVASSNTPPPFSERDTLRARPPIIPAGTKHDVLASACSCHGVPKS